MNPIYFWAIAVIAVILGIISPSFKEFPINISIGKREFLLRGTLRNLGSIIGLLLTVYALIVAINTYSDSQISGPKQQAALDASRHALEAVVILSRQQKAAIDSSAAALQTVSNTSKSQLRVMDSQLKLTANQWQDQQQRLAQKPKFEIEYKFNYYSPELTGNKIIDSTANSGVDNGSVSIEDGSFDPEKSKDPFYDKYKDRYRLVGEGTPEGFIHSSATYNEDNPYKSSFPIQFNTTRKAENGLRFFYLSVIVKNVGTLNAEDLFITVRSLRRGVSITGETVNAPEVMMEPNGMLVYSQGSKHVPLLTIYKYTKEEIRLTLRVSFREEIMNQEVPIELGAYDRYVRKIPIRIKFKVIPF